jgi:hypothetical protein
MIRLMAQTYTWKELVQEALLALGGEASLQEITKALKTYPHRPQTATWTATIRRVVRQYNIFQPFKSAKGEACYRLVELPIPSALPVGKEDPHGEQQGMLLELGRLCGYETFTNATDKKIRQFRGESLTNFATVRDTDEMLALPLEKMRTTDVMWMAEDSVGLYPRYAFEVEHSTKVKDGLLRLLKIPERFNTELYVIGPGNKEAELFTRYLRDAPFRQHAKRFHFFRYPDVAAFYQSGFTFNQHRENWHIQSRSSR